MGGSRWEGLAEENEWCFLYIATRHKDMEESVFLLTVAKLMYEVWDTRKNFGFQPCIDITPNGGALCGAKTAGRADFSLARDRKCKIELSVDLDLKILQAELHLLQVSYFFCIRSRSSQLWSWHSFLHDRDFVVAFKVRVHLVLLYCR